jgi:type VI secretion system Hcp family effector
MANTFLLIDGGKIKGSADADGVKGKGYIDIKSFDISASNPANLHEGTSAGGSVSYGNITVTKDADISSMDILAAVNNGTTFDEVELRVQSTSNGQTIDAMIMKMTMVKLVAHRTNVSGNGSINETLVIHFRAYELEYTPQDPLTGKGGTKTATTWDVAKKAPK